MQNCAPNEGKSTKNKIKITSDIRYIYINAFWSIHNCFKHNIEDLCFHLETTQASSFPCLLKYLQDKRIKILVRRDFTHPMTE